VTLSEDVVALSEETPTLPIKVKPFNHQRAAYEFALQLYGVAERGTTGCAQTREPQAKKPQANVPQAHREGVMPMIMTTQPQIRSSGCAILAEMGVG